MSFVADYSLSSPSPVSLVETSRSNWADFLGSITDAVTDTAGAVRNVAQTVADTRYALDNYDASNQVVTAAPGPARPGISPLMLVILGVGLALILKGKAES